ncbi:MAG: PqqD family protein [Lachnospiraceae bacterium]|nr:PqqD family protein [Lachnospiraceae bacterium]
MKLKAAFITQQIGDRQYMVAAGEEAARFRGMISSNRTAAAIVDLLKTETTEQEVVDAMFRRFDAPREKIESDVRKVIGILRSVGALEE